MLRVAIVAALARAASAYQPRIGSSSVPASAYAQPQRVALARGGGSSGLSIRALDGPIPPPPLKAPPAIVDGAIAAGTAKASLPPLKILLLGIISGCHIAFGACLSLMVGGAVPGIKAANPGLQRIIFGSFGLPFGLLMTLVSGAELFTGNTALVTTSVLDGKATGAQLAKSWVMSYVGNLIGSLLIAWLFAVSGVMHLGAASVAVAKCGIPWVQAFVRGILANWLVCMAVWMASGCSDLASKAVAVWFPISAFVAMGLEHSVANMAIVPLGIMLKAEVTWKTFFLSNLVPVTLGNIVGGAVAVAGAYTVAFKKL